MHNAERTILSGSLLCTIVHVQERDCSVSCLNFHYISSELLLQLKKPYYLLLVMC